MNKNIIIAILIVIIIAVVAAFVLTQPAQTQNGKLNTQINFLSQDTLKNGDSIQVELKDAQGNVIKNEKVSIAYDANGQTENYTVLTDANGHAFLKLSDEPTGQHKVKVTFNGTDKYNGCSAEKTITIEEGTSTQTTQTEQNSTASTVEYSTNQTGQGGAPLASDMESYYDADLDVFYDANGKIIGGQNDGANIWDVKNNQPVIDEQGNLV